jgi:hypothetical protein
MTYASVSVGHTCKQCANEDLGDKNRFTIDQVREYFAQNGCELLEDVYINANTKMRYICSCGNLSSITYGSFSSGVRCKQCAIERNSGENHYHWNPTLTEEERKLKRYTPEYYQFVKSVFKRDNYTCQICEQRNGDLNAHHLDGYNWCVDKRYSVDNGITLCEKCHIDFHKIYGKGDNTKEQFEEYLVFKKEACASF